MFPRKTAKGKVWYFWYYPDENTEKRIKKSTGTATKHEARQFVENFFNSLASEKKKQENITLKTFTTQFFVWDQCDWIKSQHQKGKSFSVSVAQSRRGHLDNYILPEFGNIVLNQNEELLNSKLNAGYLEKWLSKLPIANQTRNHILFSFKIVMRWAKKQRVITYNPIEDAEPFSLKSYKKRDILLLEELQQLFPAAPEQLITIWGSTYFATLFLLMATTGMRAQEVRALIWGDVIWNEGIVLINRAVKPSGEIGETKSNYGKAAFLPDRTINQLQMWRNESVYKKDHQLVFYGENEEKPLYRKRINMVLKNRLILLLNDTADRNITPHCFRTTYNTFMCKEIPPELIRLQLGHKSQTMTDRYDRGTIIDKLLPYQAEREKINSFWDNEKS